MTAQEKTGGYVYRLITHNSCTDHTHVCAALAAGLAFKRMEFFLYQQLAEDLVVCLFLSLVGLDFNGAFGRGFNRFGINICFAFSIVFILFFVLLLFWKLLQFAITIYDLLLKRTAIYGIIVLILRHRRLKL